MKKKFSINSVLSLLTILILLSFLPEKSFGQESDIEVLKRLQEITKRLKTPRSTYDYSSTTTPPIHNYGSGSASFMNHYNGVYTTSIDLGQGISLSYGNNGIQVNQVASSVGLGWNLNIGGKITRIVRGYPDDIEGIKRDTEGNYYQFVGWIHNSLFGNNNPSEIIDQFSKATSLEDRANNLEQIIGNTGTESGAYYSFTKYDSEPDLFQFTYPGNTGSFVFSSTESGTNEHKITEFIPYQDLEISYTIDEYNKISSITIMDHYGSQYLYDKYEEVTTNTGFYPSASRQEFDYGHPTYISGTFSNMINKETSYRQSWFLTKITFSNQQEITFEYEPEKIWLEQAYYQSFRDYEWSEDNEPIVDLVTNYDYEHVNNDPYESPNVKTHRLNKISSNEFEIELISNTLRTDLFTSGISSELIPKALDKIRFYSIIDGIKSVTKQIDFTYTYFESESDNDGYTIFDREENEQKQYGDYIRKRLKLDEVQIYNGDDLLPPYKFYYVKYYNDYWLPARYSYCQDFWGYFKENSTESSLVPTVYCYPNREGQYRFSVYRLDTATPGVDYAKKILDGVDRMPDEDYIHIGMLEKITYPTGGYTEFVYEPNDFVIDDITANTFIGAGIRLKEIITDGLETNSTKTSFVYENSNQESSGKLINMPLFGHLDPINSLCTELTNTSYSSWDTDDFNSYYIRGTNNENDMMEGTLGYDQVIETVNGIDGETIYYFENTATYNDYTLIGYPYYNNDQTFITASVNDYEYQYTYEVAHENDTFPIPLILEGLDTNYTSFPFSTNSNYSWNRGKLIKKEVFNSNDEVIVSEETDYDFFYGESSAPTIVYGLKNAFLKNNIPPKDLICDDKNDIIKGDYNYLYEPLTVSSKYELHTNVTSLPANLISKYSPDNQNEISDDKKISYNNNGLVKKVMYTDANGEFVTTENLYVCDLWDSSIPFPEYIDIENDETKALISLLKEHNHSQLIQSITYKGNSPNEIVTSSGIILYDLFNTGLLKLPHQKYVLTASQQIQPNDITRLNISLNGNSKYELNYDLSNYTLVETYSNYDIKGNLIEVIPEHSQPSTLLLGADQTLLIGEATNALNSEFGYSGFEYSDLNGWSLTGGASQTDIESKSGYKKLEVQNGASVSQTFTIDNESTINGYKATICAKGAGSAYLKVSVNGTLINSASLSQSADWELLTVHITRQDLAQFSASQQLLIKVESGNPSANMCYLDDIRFYPDDAVINTYTYTHSGLTASVCDINSSYQFFEYDDLGRLKYVRDKDLNILRAIETFIGDPCDFHFYPDDPLESVVKVNEPVRFIRNHKNTQSATFVCSGKFNHTTTDDNFVYTFSSTGTYNVSLEMVIDGVTYSTTKTITVTL